MSMGTRYRRATMRPREPNADECKDILEDIRRHFENNDSYEVIGREPIYNRQALLVLTAWLRHKAYWCTGNRNTKTEESEKA